MNLLLRPDTICIMIGCVIASWIDSIFTMTESFLANKGWTLNLLILDVSLLIGLNTSF